MIKKPLLIFIALVFITSFAFSNTNDSTILAIRIFDVLFYFNSEYLKPDSQPVLDSVITFLNMHPGVSVEIGGHTDDEGDAGYNMYLSESRAKSIQRYL